MRIYEDLRGLQRRLSIIQACMVVAMALLVAYFWHLQVLRGRHYKELAENNRIRSVLIPAPRGALFDRSGRILVENRSSFNIVMTAEHNPDLQLSVERMATLLHVPLEQVRARMAGQGPRFRSVVVKADATEADVAAVEARRLEFPEATVDVVPMRSYPLGPEPRTAWAAWARSPTASSSPRCSRASTPGSWSARRASSTSTTGC